MAFLNTLIILVSSSLILVWLMLKRKYNFWRQRGITTVPYNLVWGNVKDAVFQRNSIADRVTCFYQSFKSQGLKHGGIYFFWNPMYVPIDLEIVKSIMQTDFQHFVDRGIYYDEKNNPISAHLFSLAGKKWKLLRHKLTPTFTSGKMKMMFETLVECTNRLYKVMDRETHDAVDVKDVLGRFTTDVIGSCAFGLDCNSLENPNSEFRAKGKRLFHRNFMENLRSIITFVLPDISKALKIKLISEEVNDFFMGVVRDNVAYREKNNIFRKDFMHLLIQLKNRGKLVDDEKLTLENITEEDNKITLEEIAAQAFVFFAAGYETSSTTMTFCLYELAKNKIIQEKLREHIRNVMAAHKNQLTYEAAMDMVYLEQSINETLRKYPPLTSLSRICTKEYKVPGTDLVLEKGIRVMIPVYGIHHDPNYYPDPEKFDPDRFSDINKKTRPGFSFIPFGEGPRVCIGARFGMMQTKVGLIALLLNYEFSVNEKTQEPLEYDPQSFTLSTKGDMWLNVKKLRDNVIELMPNKQAE